MKVKYTIEEFKMAADKVIMERRVTEPTEEYDFYNDRLVEAKRKKFPMVIVEEDNLRFSIVDIISYVLSQLILDYMVLFSENYNTFMQGRDCLLIMKNEFLFRSLFLTYGSKNYSTLQLLQEGNLIPENKQFDIKGMPIAKITLPDSTKSSLQNILEYDILRNSFVDQIDIFKKLTILEKQIYRSIRNKKKEYHKPARIKSQSSYKDPMSQQGIKASIVYNRIKSKDEPIIDLGLRNTILIIKTNINLKNIEVIMNDFPQYYMRMKQALESPEYKGVIEAVAIPQDMEIPDWIIPFIDYDTIIQDNLRNFPIEELGMSRTNSSHVFKSNIITL